MIQEAIAKRQLHYEQVRDRSDPAVMDSLFFETGETAHDMNHSIAQNWKKLGERFCKQVIKFASNSKERIKKRGGKNLAVTKERS
jgi:hypothetical protein